MYIHMSSINLSPKNMTVKEKVSDNMECTKIKDGEIKPG